MAFPHDSLFRRTFADPVQAAALFQCALPKALADAIDWSTLVSLSNTITDENLGKHLTDGLFAVRLRDFDLWLVLVPEHKAREERETVLQQLRYAIEYWLQWVVEHPDSEGLPPIVPVLFHHGAEPWTGPVSLRDHFDLAGLDAVRAKAPALAELIAGCSLSMPLSVLDLAVHDEDWLRRAPFPDLAKLALLCMRFVRFQEPEAAIATLDRWGWLVAALRSAPWGQLGLSGIESYLLEITDLNPEQLRAMVQRAIGSDEEFVSTAERMRRASWKEGKEEGKQEGKQEGRVLGASQQAIDTVLRLLARRFGPVPEPVAARIRAAALTDLDRWTDRILDALTLDDVFA